MGLLISPSPFYTYLNFLKGEGGSRGAVSKYMHLLLSSFLPVFYIGISTSRDPSGCY